MMRIEPRVSGPVVAALMLAVTVLAALFAGWTPLIFSIVIVFLFAGPHNWLEARYFLTRLPGRFGKLRGFFLFSALGIVALTASFAVLPWLGERLHWEAATWTTALAVWNTLLVGWIAVLVQWRMRQSPRRDWGWTLPVAFLVIGLNWLYPFVVSIAVVYLHPLVALWLLDRELLRSRPTWRPAYHACLAALPLLLAVLWWRLWDAPPLPGDTELFRAIVQHAGAQFLTGVSSHALVATHTFLEMVHYAVWIIAIPLVGLRIAPWKLSNVPLTKHSTAWRRIIVAVLVAGLGISAVLWLGFLADYSTTRYIYFTVALVHVLAEVPFLLRAL
jgi:hypothetical protein